MEFRLSRTAALVASIALVTLLALTGCGSDDSNPLDPGGAVAEVAAGNAALANGDYVSANAHYRAALVKDPNNREANFGAAVTEVYVLQGDPEAAEIIDFIGAQTRAVRAPGATRSKPRNGRDVILGATNALRLNPEAAGRGVMGLFRVAADDPPAASDIQRVIKTKLMPRLAYAEARLQALEAFPDLQIILTPEMTGQPDPIEIDNGDILMLDAVVNGVQGWLGMVVAYNFDGAAEGANAESLLANGTDFGKLHADGALQLASARSNLLLVNGRIDAAVASIEDETDDQEDDGIPASALQEAGFLQTMEDVDQLTASLSGTVAIEVNDYQGSPVDLQVDIGKFFTSPITDIKTKLPAHTFVNGEPVLDDPITFPDPTFNNIFPLMTNDLWRQFLGPVGPPTSITKRLR